MLTLETILKVISDAVEKHNEPVEAHNLKARNNNIGKSYRDKNYMDHMEEIGESDPTNLFDDYDLDFGDFEFKEVDDFGGEGQGDHCHKVYLVTNTKTGETAHIKFDGYYNSQDGSSYDDEPYLVESYIKQVKDWKAV